MKRSRCPHQINSMDSQKTIGTGVEYCLRYIIKCKKIQTFMYIHIQKNICMCLYRQRYVYVYVNMYTYMYMCGQLGPTICDPMDCG